MEKGGNNIHYRCRLIKITIFIVLFFNLFTLINAQSVDAKISDHISFYSYFDIEYNSSILNEDLMIHKSVNLPITISYKTDLPKQFVDKFDLIPFMIRNKIIYGKSLPQQIINISVLNKEEINWAQLNLTTSKFYVGGIPFKGEESRIKTSLILSPFEEAPAEVHTIKLKVECGNLGMLKGAEYETEIQFKPQFIPTVEIKPLDSLRLVAPQKSINFKIIIENFSNKKVRVYSDTITADPKWNPMINPPFLDIDPMDGSNFVFSVISPFDFGWHDAIEEFNINFTTQIFPIRTNSTISGPYQITLEVKNYGFSTPGFELIGFICIISAFIVVRKIRRRNC